MDRNRVALIVNKNCCTTIKTDDAIEGSIDLIIKEGSGYLIRYDIVITASHTLDCNEWINANGELMYWVRLLGFEKHSQKWTEYQARLLRKSSKYDLALLKLDNGPYSCAQEFGTDVKLAKVPDGGVPGKFEVRGIGFPKAQRNNTGYQNGEAVSGEFTRIADRISCPELSISVTSDPPASPAGWAGISGTSLFVNQDGVDLLACVIVETDGEQGFSAKRLRAIPISVLLEEGEEEFFADFKSKPKLEVLQFQHQLINSSNGEPEDSQYNESSDSMQQEFLENLRTYRKYKNVNKNDIMKMNVQDSILRDIWSFIVDGSNIDVKNEVFELCQTDTDLHRILKPILKIANISSDDETILTDTDLINYLAAGEQPGGFLIDSKIMQGYSKLLKKLLIYSLYRYPSILFDNRQIFEKLETLAKRDELFWIEFFVDIYLRHVCGNIRLSKDFLSAIKKTCIKYKKSYPSKPIVKLWDMITDPFYVSQHSDRSSVESQIFSTANTCENNIEVKWCIASIHRIIPMYRNDMSSEEDSTTSYFNSSSLINSLFLKEAFRTDLIDNSPQFQIIYLQNLLLRSSLHSGEQNTQEYKEHSKKCLEDYAKHFLEIHEHLSYSSRCYLQLEYACHLHMFCKTVSRIFNKDNDDLNRKAGLNELNGLEVKLLRVSTKKNLFEGCPLLENPELQYALKRIKDPFKDLDALISTLEIYILHSYDYYAKQLIEFNHLELRRFPGLAHIKYIIPSLNKAILISLKKFISEQHSVSDPNFYAKSAPMLARIRRNDNIDLIREYITKAMKADEYFIMRNATHIMWGLYSCHYYGAEEHQLQIQKMADKVGQIAVILDEKDNVNQQIKPNICWAYYAGIKWIQRRAEGQFIDELCKVVLQREEYNLCYGKVRNYGAYLPNKIWDVINQYSDKSIFAFILSKSTIVPEVWNIVGTTIMCNRFKASSLSSELEKADYYYTVAKCFASGDDERVNTYCFNYIKSHSLLIQNSHFSIGDDNEFIKDVAWYLTQRKYGARLFPYKKECTRDYLRLLLQHWNDLHYATKEELKKFLDNKWLRKMLDEEVEFKQLLDLLGESNMTTATPNL
jgi:hypothetical protein